MSDYTPMTHDEIERAEAAPRLKTYDELEQQLTAANARVEALEAALKEIVEVDDSGTWSASDCRNIARAAAPKQEKSDD